MTYKNPAEEAPQLDDLGNVVPKGYEYYEKMVTPRDGLDVPGAYFKWYNLYPPGIEITQEQVAQCRAFLLAEAGAGALKMEGELGFVILHRAGPMLLLLVTTWRNTNEMWLSVYAKHANKSDNYSPIQFETPHRGTYCVWELRVVWHERDAWVRFIQSNRDTEAKLAYLNDTFSGTT